MNGMWLDQNGWWRYGQAEHNARVQHIVANGQPVDCAVQYWPPLDPSRGADEGLYVIEFFPKSGYVHLSENHAQAPWGYHCSLLRPNQLTTPALVHDLCQVVSQVEGASGTMDVWYVNDRSTMFPNWHGVILGPVWGEIQRLRAAGNHQGPVTVSA